VKPSSHRPPECAWIGAPPTADRRSRTDRRAVQLDTIHLCFSAGAWLTSSRTTFRRIVPTFGAVCWPGQRVLKYRPRRTRCSPAASGLNRGSRGRSRSRDFGRVMQPASCSAPYEPLCITTNLTGPSLCTAADKCVHITPAPAGSREPEPWRRPKAVMCRSGGDGVLPVRVPLGFEGPAWCAVARGMPRRCVWTHEAFPPSRRWYDRARSAGGPRSRVN
jgi:hypothetical protein